MHSFPVRVVVAARRKSARAEFAGEIVYARVLNEVVDEGFAQLKRFVAVLRHEIIFKKKNNTLIFQLGA